MSTTIMNRVPSGVKPANDGLLMNAFLFERPPRSTPIR
jgi:hypothetical protein